MKKLLLLAVALLVTGASLLTSTAFAVENGGIGGKPAHPRADNPRTQSIFIYTLQPGQSAEDGVAIFNNTNKERTISVYPVDAVVASGGNFSCAQKVETKTSVGSWIQLDKEQVTVPANDNVTIPFTITAPDKVDVGEHNGCIAIEDASQKTDQTSQNGVVLGFRSAIRVAVTIPGKIVKSVAITSVDVTRLDNGNFRITPNLKNTGNVSLDTTLNTTLDPIVGDGPTQANGTFPVLADTTASWNFEFERPFWGGWYHARVSAVYNSDPETGLGAEGGQQKTISASSGLFFAPPKPLAFLIEVGLIGLIVAGVIWLFNRRTHKHHVKQHWTHYKVKTGDTIQDIAEKYDISWKKLATANKLKPPYTVKSGQDLKVPPKISGKE